MLKFLVIICTYINIHATSSNVCMHLTHYTMTSLLQNYGKKFGKGDIVGCFLDLESEPVVMSFTVNGQHQGIAYEVSHSDLGDQALFPHILTKNTSFRVSDFASVLLHTVKFSCNFCE